MIQAPKSAQMYQTEILAALVKTGISQVSPGGKARAFCDIVGAKIGELESRSYAALSQTLLPYATGDNLDFLGEMYGVSRLQSQDVSSSLFDNNFEFYVLRGTFGSINNGVDITIPAGTRIYTASDSGPVCVTTVDTILPAAAMVQSVSVTSLNSGVNGNSPAGVYTRHNFTNYAGKAYGSLLVTNNYGLTGGTDVETDDDYRYRINLKLQSEGGSSAPDLRLALLSLAGIQDVVFTREAGTFDVYVYGTDPNVAPSLLSMVQSVLDQKVAYPIVGSAVAPDLVQISLATTAQFAANMSPADRSAAMTAGVLAAENYINNLKVGQMLVINDIANAIINADSRILDIGQPDRPLDEIFIWRTRITDGSQYSRYLVANYTPQIGERIVALPNGITISAAS